MMLYRIEFTLVVIAALVMTMLPASPADAETKAPFVRPSVQDMAVDRSLLQDIAAVGIVIVKDGRIRTRLYTADALAADGELTVDGHVNGVVLLGRQPLTASVDNRPMRRIRADANGYFRLDHFGRLSERQFRSTFLPADSQMDEDDGRQIRYASFPRVPGSALSAARRFPIRIDRQGQTVTMTIHQRPRKKLDICDPSFSEAPDVYCLGDDAQRFDPASADYRARMQAFLSGIRAVETVGRQRLIERVHFIQFEGAHNAYTFAGRPDIWIYNQIFWSESVAELRTIAEHESLHLFSDRLGLPENSPIRELFADLCGHGPFSMERFSIMSHGRVRDGAAAAAPESGLFFDFISEANFIRGMKGGHAQDDVDEFCASFLHTLMYVDRLESLIAMPVIRRDGSVTDLSGKQRQRLLGDYARVLSTVLAGSPATLPADFRGLVHRAQATIHRIRSAAGKDGGTAMPAAS